MAIGTTRLPDAEALCDQTSVFVTVDRMFADRADRILVRVEPTDAGYRVVQPSLAACATDASRAPTIERFVRQYTRREFLYDLSAAPKAFEDLTQAYQKVIPASFAKQAILAAPADVPAFQSNAPALWIFSQARAQHCYNRYMRQGWSGLMPEVCIDQTITMPLDRQWITWGWPNRFLSRMGEAGVRTIVVANQSGWDGIDRADQIPEVPKDFKGTLLVKDISVIGPALRD